MSNGKSSVFLNDSGNIVDVLRRAAITLTENKKCMKYDCSRPIVLDRTFLYADDGSTSEYIRLWNVTTTKVRRGMCALHLTSFVK